MHVVSRCVLVERFLSTANCIRCSFFPVVASCLMNSLRAFRMFFLFLLFVSASTCVPVPPCLCAGPEGIVLIVLARPVASKHCGHAHVLANLTLINRQHNDHKGATHFDRQQVKEYESWETENAFSCVPTEEWRGWRCWIRGRRNAHTRQLPTRRAGCCNQRVSDAQTRARCDFDRRIDDSGIDSRSGIVERIELLRSNVRLKAICSCLDTAFFTTGVTQKSV